MPMTTSSFAEPSAAGPRFAISGYVSPRLSRAALPERKHFLLIQHIANVVELQAAVLSDTAIGRSPGPR